MALVVLVCGFTNAIAYMSQCCDQTDRVIAHVVIPGVTPLVFLWLWNDVANHASVVYDHESISKASWFGKYGVKTLRWDEITHVNTHHGGGTMVMRLFGVGTRITVCPGMYADTEQFHSALLRHLADLPESQRSYTRGSR